jgi:hypothetical protein
MKPRTVEEVLACLAAVLRREKHYHGKPCRSGHGTLRYVSTRACVKCQHLWDKGYRTKQDKVRQ